MAATALLPHRGAPHYVLHRRRDRPAPSAISRSRSTRGGRSVSSASPAPGKSATSYVDPAPSAGTRRRHRSGSRDVPRPRSSFTFRSGDMFAVRGAAISMIFQEPMTSLNPVLTVGQPDHGGDTRPPEGRQGGGASSAPFACWRKWGCRIPNASHRHVPARALRRHAAARDDRDGARRATRSCSSPTSRRPRST